MNAAVALSGVGLLAAALVVLVRQGSVGRLCDEDGRPSPRRHVLERPAGPDAESMAADASEDRRGPGDRDPGWVPLSEAATSAGCTESWLVDRCRDGRLPSRPALGSGPLVPMATVQALVSGRISD